MNTIKIYQVDAFTGSLFSGNPAAVCLLNDWLEDKKLQSIAAENNLAETAFVIQQDDFFEIRWFTPTLEVDLCGHATLAAAYVIFNCLNYKALEIVFQSPRSGILKVTQQNGILYLDFPTDSLESRTNFNQMKDCLGVLPVEIYKGKTDFIAIVDSEAVVLSIIPDYTEIAGLNARGLIVTSKGTKVDFVSRFFAPQSGINEDPVTGSAHTSLIPLWSEKLGKNEMTAAQLSKRGGKLICIHKGERCMIGGQARLYMTGEIYIE